MKKISILFLSIFGSLTLAAQQDLSIVNSRYDEIQPVFHPNGRELYFTRAFDSTNVGGKKDQGDIWKSELNEDGSWSAPKNLGSPVNNKFFNAVAGFSPDGKVMFLHGHYPTDGKPPRSQGLSYSVWKGSGWTFPKKVEVEYFMNRSAHQSGTVSADGKILLLAMDSYGSHGAEDIYVSFFDGNKFSQPKNLGATINTKLQEMTPTLAPDNKTLFFSSNGHPGKGGRDIFKSTRLDDSWTEWTTPESLGSEVNSDGVELSFIIAHDMKWGLYTTSVNSDGYGDIRYYRMPKDSVFEVQEEEVADLALGLSESSFEVLNKVEKMFVGSVHDDKTRKFITASLLVRSRDGQYEDSLKLGEGQRKFEISVPDSLTRLYVEVRSKGYMPTTETLYLEGSLTERSYYLAPLEVGATIKLDKVYFEKGTALLIDNSYTELDKIVEIMHENSGMAIQLAGHTDNQGDARKNLELSQNRVETVKSYLMNKGIDGSRINGKGYGGTQPIASNATEETRKLNRRVEFVITEF